MALSQIALSFDEPVQEPAVKKAAPVKTDRKPRPVDLAKKPAGKRGRIKLSELDAKAHLISIPDDEVLFSKQYYPIGVVAEMFKVNQSQIRTWENEFDILKPKKNGKGNRLFRPEDIKNLKMIYHLIREKKYTLEGAKTFLKKNEKAEERYLLVEDLKKLKSFLLELKATL